MASYGTCGGVMPLDKDLLVLLELFNKLNRDLKCLCDNIWRCKSKPLCQGNISNVVRLVDLNPDQIFSLGCVLDIMSSLLVSILNELRVAIEHVPRIIREHGGVTSSEVERSSIGVTNEGSSSGSPLMEVKPLFSLWKILVSDAQSCSGMLENCEGHTLGCQWSSRKPPGLRVTYVAAIVFEIGKLVESILWNTPPCPPIFSAGCSKVRYTNELFPEATGVTAPVTFFSLTVAFRMYGLGVGILSKTDSGTPKFFARISLGVCASQSSMLKVVLLPD